MSKNKCLNCGVDSFEELLHVDQFPILFGAVAKEKKDQVKKYPLTIAYCKECSMVQQINLLPGSVLDEVYTSDYYSCPAPSTNPVGRRVIEEFYTFFKDKTSALDKSDKKLLEIACFDGYLLTKLKNDGWDVYGCDPAGQTSLAIESLGKEPIINDFYSKDLYPEKHFDVIVFRHLLEHLYDLHSFLDDIFYTLKDDGCIFIEVPNIYHTLSTGSFASFFHQHISYFSIEVIEKLLQKHNFVIETYQATSVLHIKAKKNLGSDDYDVVSTSNVLDANVEQFLQKAIKNKKRIKTVFDTASNEKIALIGASVMATTIINMSSSQDRAKISCIFDNDISKRGKYIVGSNGPILPVEKVKTEDFDVIIICSYIFSDEMTAQLLELGVDKTKIIHV